MEHSRRNTHRLQLSQYGITILNQRIVWKDDIEFVTEFPCLLGHPVVWMLGIANSTYGRRHSKLFPLTVMFRGTPCISGRNQI